MALTKGQTEGVINLFVSSFIRSDEAEKKKLLLEFEDIFGKSISNWQSICKEKIEQYTSDPGIVKNFDEMLSRNGEKSDIDIFEVRRLEESDLSQVRELINTTFGMCLTWYDDEKFLKFICSGYSVVACNGEEIVGVALAFEMPDYNTSTIYLDTFVVAESIRDGGLGKKMLKYICSLVPKQNNVKLKLQTDRTSEAYHIYKHWGFQEDELVHMHKYVII